MHNHYLSGYHLNLLWGCVFELWESVFGCYFLVILLSWTQLLWCGDVVLFWQPVLCYLNNFLLLKKDLWPLNVFYVNTNNIHYLILLVDKNKDKSSTLMHPIWKILVEFKTMHVLLVIIYVTHMIIFLCSCF